MTKHLGEQIRAWREEKRMSQAELAELVGVQLVTVGRWERGEAKPYQRNIEEIRRVTENAVDEPAEAERAPVYDLAERVAALEARVELLEASAGRGGHLGRPTSREDSAADLAAREDAAAKRKRQRRRVRRPPSA